MYYIRGSGLWKNCWSFHTNGPVARSVHHVDDLLSRVGFSDQRIEEYKTIGNTTGDRWGFGANAVNTNIAEIDWI